MARELSALATGHALILVLAALLDLAIGDPPYRAHPIRLMGATLSWTERALRAAGADGYGGGVALLVVLAVVWVGGTCGLVLGAAHWSAPAGLVVELFFVYSFLALGDLLRHVWAVERPLTHGDLAGAHTAIARLVGRDTAPMDAGACRRAAVESLSENLTDGYTSPLFWYVAAGLPGLVFFKVASTMDSMVGYKTPRYLRFGWCGARLDDVMNFIPARMTWLLTGAVAALLPGCSALKAWRIGWQQHGILLGPNSGWSEAAAAGAIQRRIVGPIWLRGVLVTETWIGDPADPPVETRADLVRAMGLVAGVGLAAISIVVLLLW